MVFACMIERAAAVAGLELKAVSMSLRHAVSGAPRPVQPCHRTICGSIMGSLYPMVRLPMHAFRTIWEFVYRARTSAESHPNLLRLHETPLKHRLTLACIGQSKTT